MLSEYDVGNDLGFGISVEAGGEFATLHVELLTQHGGGELYVERLVADGEVLGVACDDGAHHVLPPLDETVLVERGFETLLTEILAYEVANGFGIGASHAFQLLTCHAAVDNGIELVVACGGRYDTVEVSAVDVGDEDLPESVARDEADNLLHA